MNNGVTYLKGLQNSETGAISGFGGDWALTAFAAAKVAAADVNKGGKETTDARSWYEKEVGAVGWPGEGAAATDFERAALISYAAGIDPARVSKRQNLIAKVASYYQPASPGYYGSTFNATVFGLLALADTKTTSGRPAGTPGGPRPGGRSGESQPAHRRRLDLGQSGGQRRSAGQSLRTRHDRRGDGGALRSRRRQHERSDRQQRRTTSSRNSSKRAAPSNRNSASTPSSNAWAVQRAQSLRDRSPGDRIHRLGSGEKHAAQLPHLPAGGRRRVQVPDLRQHRQPVREPGRGARRSAAAASPRPRRCRQAARRSGRASPNSPPAKRKPARWR